MKTKLETNNSNYKSKKGDIKVVNLWDKGICNLHNSAVAKHLHKCSVHQHEKRDKMCSSNASATANNI
jgi:hypothetical protein